MLARVEGEGALELDIEDGRITRTNLRIFEPPRLFERFLEGRAYDEIPDLVARICGICPVAYQMSAVQAFEDGFGCDPGPWVRAMRRVFYCGEWIQSHALHLHLLAAPDFFGCDTVVALARREPEAVRRGFALQALGNELIALFGARSVHPVGARVGGFHHAPDPQRVAALLVRLREGVGFAQELLAWTACWEIPAVEQEFVSVALRHAEEYPMYRGRLFSDHGLDAAVSEFEDHVTERQVPHSTALHALLGGRPYLVGPLARLNLNRDRLPGPVARALAATGVDFPSRNPFHAALARATEILLALHEACRLLEGYALPERPAVPAIPRAGTAFGATEAPRGLLWHRYDVDGGGRVRRARIVPPTSQNQERIEEDLRLSLERFGLGRPDEELRAHCETVIRSYDPCISCATHFLRLRVRRA